MNDEKRVYEVEILKKYGSCNNSLFEKMCKKGDVTATKIQELVGARIKITGYAICKITTNEKEFKIGYYNTDEYGLFSTGSEVFCDSVSDYIEDTKDFFIKEVKTTRGKTYKAVPIINSNSENTENSKDNSKDELPF